MKGSKELIEHYNKREEELGEKATKFNMYLEGYAEGYGDTKAYMIDKACKAHCEYCDHTCPKDGKCYILEYIRKAMEE
ncbi:MAG: hypothetical protein MJZ12_00005 [Prevotella sp.]|nr:hypothetical protein [Prevotella sp.]